MYLICANNKLAASGSQQENTDVKNEKHKEENSTNDELSEWHEAHTSEGYTYYWNTKTKGKLYSAQTVTVTIH